MTNTFLKSPSRPGAAKYFWLPLILCLGAVNLQAAVNTWTWAAGTTANWSVTADWTGAPVAGGVANGAGNIAQQTSTSATPTAPTTTLDVTETIGQVKNTPASGRVWTINYDGTHAMTLDNTGGGNNVFGDANSALEYTSSGALNFFPSIIIQNTDLDIGKTFGGTTDAGMTLGQASPQTTITATSARTLNFLNGAAGANKGMTVVYTIGGSGSVINIVNKTVGATGAVTLTGAVGPNASVVQNSTTATLILNNTANNYTGTTTVTAGTLQLGQVNAIPSASSVSVTGTLNLNGKSDTIDGLSGGGTVDGTSGTPVLIVGGNNSGGIFSGIIKNTAGTLAVAKMGSGSLTLSGANLYTGGTVVSNGTLLVSNASGSGTGTGTVTVTNGSPTAAGTLGGNGSISGDITLISAVSTALAQTRPGSAGAGATNTFGGNLMYGTNSLATFDLGSTAAAGQNGQIIVSGTSSVLSIDDTNVAVGISCGSTLDTAADYVLFKLTGATPTIIGSFSNSPVWLASTPTGAVYYSIKTIGNNVVLHYFNPNSPTGIGSASPASLARNHQTTITVVVTPAPASSSVISSVVVNLTAIGLGFQSLVDSGDNRTFTNTFTVGPGVVAGNLSLPATITDAASAQGLVAISLNVLPTPDAWNGGAGDNNWSSVLNWSTAAIPLTGDSVFFGTTRFAPVVDTSFNLSALTFNSGAGSFVITSSGGSSLTLGAGLTNNSATLQSLNVPLTLGAAQTFNAAAGDLALSQNIINGGALTITDGGHNTTLGNIISGGGSLTKTGVGTNTLSAANTFTGGVNLNGGTVNANATETAGTSGPLGASGTISFGGGTLQYSAADTADYSGRFSILASQAYSIDTAGQAVTFATALTSSGGSLTKTGNGTLTLPAANTYSGNITVNGGTLVASRTGVAAGTAGSMGNANIAGRTITINNGAGIAFTAANIMGQAGTSKNPNLPAVTINGGALNSVWAANALGNVTLNGGTMIAGANRPGSSSAGPNYATASYKNAYLSFQLYSNVTVTGSSPSFIQGNTNVFTLVQDGVSLAVSSTFDVADVTGNSNVDLTVSAALGDRNADNTTVGPGALVKAGAGTMLLSGLNFYTGGTTVSAGTLVAGSTDNQNLPAYTTANGGTGTQYAGAANVAGPFGLPGAGVTLGDLNTLSSSPTLLIGGAFTVSQPITVANQVTTGTYMLGGSKDTNAIFSGSITVNQPLTISQAANTGTNALLITGGISSGGGTETITFAGPGNVNVNTTGIADGGGVLAVNVTGGTANLSAANSYSGGTIVTNTSSTVAGTLAGNGTIAGNVVVASFSATALARTFPGGAATSTIGGNLTYGPNSEADFNLTSFYNGANDQIVLNGGSSVLTGGGVKVGINCGTVLDKGQDYVLFNVNAGGTIAGVFNATPRWLGTTPSGSAFYSVVVTNGNQVVLHYSGPAVPTITSATASPSSVAHNQTTTFTVAVTTGANPTIASVVVDLSSIGGSATQALFNSGGNVFTNTVLIGPGASVGTFALPVTATDAASAQGFALMTGFSVTSSAVTWNGASVSDNNWTDNNNWNSQQGPGYVGDNVTMAGTTRLTPVVNTNYSLTSLTFDGSAGSFVITNLTGNTLTLSADASANPPIMVNNSANPQTVSVPVNLAAPLTVNAAAGEITLGSINEGTNLLAITDNNFGTKITGIITGSGGVTKTGTGTNTLSGSNTYSGLTTVSSGSTLRLLANAGNTNAAGISSALSPASTLTLNSGSFLHLRADSNVTFTNAGIALDNASDTYNFDVKSANGVATGNTLKLAGTLAFANNSAQVINVTGSGNYGLSLGAITAVATSHNPYNGVSINVVPSITTTIASYTAGNFGSYLNLMGGGNVTVTGNVGNTSNGSTILFVNDGTTVTLQGLSVKSGTGDAYRYFVPNGTLVLDNSTALVNNAGSIGTLGTQTLFILGAAANVLTSAGFSYPATLLPAVNNAYNCSLYLGDANFPNGGLTLAANMTLNISDGDTTPFVNSGTMTVGGQNTSGTNIYANSIILGWSANLGKSVTLVAATGGEVDFTGSIQTNGTDVTAGVTVGDGTHGGIVKFTGANSYAGGTAVANGTLLVANTTGSGTGTNSVTVSSGAKLGGSGIIGGNVTWLPGAGAVFTAGSPLTVGGTLALNANVATVNVPGATPLAAGNYALANYVAAGSTGLFTATPVVTGAGLASGNTATVVTGGGNVTLNVVSGINTTPTNIVSRVNGNKLELTWPADHTGWILQAQTNSLIKGLGTNWADVAGSTSVNSVTNTINAANGTVFYRLKH